MFKKLQIIGLPGAGKTTQIQKYLKNNNSNICFLDICNFKGIYRERLFRQTIINYQQDVIAESACGIQGIGYVIKINTPIEQIYTQLLERDNFLDEDYLSLLNTQMIVADCTLTVPEDLPGLLKIIFKR